MTVIIEGVERMDWRGRDIARAYRRAALRSRMLAPGAALRREHARLAALHSAHNSTRPTLLSLLRFENFLEAALDEDPLRSDLRPQRIDTRYAIDKALSDDPDDVNGA